MTPIGKRLPHEIIRRCPLVIYVGIFVQTDALLLKPHITVKDAFFQPNVCSPDFPLSESGRDGSTDGLGSVYAWRASGLSSRPFTLNA